MQFALVPCYPAVMSLDFVREASQDESNFDSADA